jgi:serine-type D-Ala-D-Ala carboxypeptidase/endopeptidase
MRQGRNASSSLALAALLAAPGQSAADSALLEEAVGLSGLAMFMESGATMDAIALGWLLEMADGHRPMILQKSGGLAGFMTYVAFAPGRGAGAFVAVHRIDSRCSRV